MFKRSDQDSRRSVHIIVDGAAVEAREGDTVAAALLASGRDVAARPPVSGAPRAPYCMMGVCFDCLVTIDGVGNRQGCLVPVREGMQIEIQQRQAGDRPMTRLAKLRSATTSSSSAAGPPALPPLRLRREAGLSTLLLDENPGARRPGLSRHHLDPGDGTRPSSAPTTGRGADAGPGGRDRAARRSSSGATVWSLDRESRDRRVGRRRAPLRQGAPRDSGDRRAGAAVSDSRLDTARRDDGRRRADVLKSSGLVPDGRDGDRRAGPAALAAGGADPARRRPHRRHPRHDAGAQLSCARCLTLPAFLLSPYFAKGLALLREVRRKVRVVRGVTRTRGRWRRQAARR